MISLSTQQLIATENLALYGPLKPENEHGYTEEQMNRLGKESLNDEEVKFVTKQGIEYVLRADPLGKRCGEGEFFTF